MPNLKERRQELMVKANAILDGAKADGVELTAEQATAVEGFITEIKAIDEQIAAAIEGDKLLSALGAIGGGSAESSGAKWRYGRAKGTGTMDLSVKGLKAIAREATGNAVFGTTPMGQKALVTAGQSITSIPMLGDVVTDGKPPVSLLEALQSRTTTTPTWQYLRQTGRTTNAAFVESGGVKPTSDYATETVDGKLSVLAHISQPVDKYVLGDAPALERFLSDEMNYGIRSALEAQLVGGDGTAPNLLGLLNTVGIQTQAFVTDVLSTTRSAITAVETLGLNANLFVINPLDWQAIELLRTDTAGNLEFGGPVDRAARKLWGVQVVVSTAVAAGTALLLDTSSVEVVTDGGLAVEWSDAVSDDFQRNQKRVRVEGRFGLDVFRPLGVVKITTTTP